MSINKFLSDVFGIIGLFILIPAYILVPIEWKFFIFKTESVIFLLLGISLLAFSYFSSKAKKEIILDERMIRIGGKSNAYALLITLIFALLVATIAKEAELPWLSIPVAMIGVIFVLVISSRMIFEILLRIPNAEEK